MTGDLEKVFDALWHLFNSRYPFFSLRDVDWGQQFDTFRPKVTEHTGDDEFFDILCSMLAPLNDGHVELIVPATGKQKRRVFNPESESRFSREFDPSDRLFETTEKTLTAREFEPLKKTDAWILRYCRSPKFGYLRIIELEGIGKQKLTSALDQISRDFADLDGMIIDIRDNPGGDDWVVLTILNRFCDRKLVAFHRKTKIGPGAEAFSPLKTWHMEPQGETQFTKPVILLTCDAVFSGAEVFSLAARELPHVTIVGEPTAGIFSYQLEKTLPNGWQVRLSYQVYTSAGMECFEGVGVPPDLEVINTQADIVSGTDPLIIRALDLLAV